MDLDRGTLLNSDRATSVRTFLGGRGRCSVFRVSICATLAALAPQLLVDDQCRPPRPSQRPGDILEVQSTDHSTST